MNVPKFIRQDPPLRAVKAGESSPEQFADIGKLVLAARERGDRMADEAKLPPAITLPPTASNIFAGNALDLLKKREEILNEAIMRAGDLELLAGEMIACGARVQDFQRHTQNLTTAILEARPALAVLPAAEAEAEVIPLRQTTDVSLPSDVESEGA